MDIKNKKKITTLEINLNYTNIFMNFYLINSFENLLLYINVHYDFVVISDIIFSFFNNVYLPYTYTLKNELIKYLIKLKENEKTYEVMIENMIQYIEKLNIFIFFEKNYKTLLINTPILEIFNNNKIQLDVLTKPENIFILQKILFWDDIKNNDNVNVIFFNYYNNADNIISNALTMIKIETNKILLFMKFIKNLYICINTILCYSEDNDFINSFFNVYV